MSESLQILFVVKMSIDVWNSLVQTWKELSKGLTHFRIWS